MATASTSKIPDVDSLSCPICLEIYEKPASIQCGHIPSLMSNLMSEVSSSAAKNSLERQLQMKTKELQDMREKCSDLENRNVSLAADKERLKVQVKEKESQLQVVQNKWDCLERDVTHYISEIKSLKRLLEVEKEERNNMDSKAMVLLEEITKQNEHAQKLREETTREEVDTCHEIIAQLEEERKSLNKKIDRLEQEIKDERQTSNKANSKVTELQGRLSQYAGIAEPQCPMCRVQFDPSKKQRVHALDKRISSTKGTCQGCSKKMTLSKLRSHNASCPKLKTSLTFKPVAETSQPMPKTVPNRSTFTCPVCGQKNLDTHSLVKHSLDKHKNTNAQVVCPICAIMPWGDPAQKSGNFISHLNLRHRFEYDTFVDYQQDDDTMLQAAIKASMEQM